MSPTELSEKLKSFDNLPNDAIVSDPVAAAFLGTSTKTLRRNNPVKVIKVSARRQGRRVGDLRALSRGEGVAV